MVESRTVKITVHRGEVTDVDGLPEDYNYIINDLDAQESA